MNKFVLLIFVSTFLISCQSVKDGLTGVKRNNSDEFLIEKKNPLVMPPDIDDLPEPKGNNGIKEAESDFEKTLKSKDSKKTKSNSEKTGTLQESIIKKIEQ